LGGRAEESEGESEENTGPFHPSGSVCPRWERCHPGGPVDRVDRAGWKPALPSRGSASVQNAQLADELIFPGLVLVAVADEDRGSAHGVCSGKHGDSIRRAAAADVETSHENVETPSRNTEKPATYVEKPGKFSTFFDICMTLCSTKAETSKMNAEKSQE
jgi:hypothetical protein